MQQDNSEQVILDPKLIAKEYIRTWFFLGNFLDDTHLFFTLKGWNQRLFREAFPSTFLRFFARFSNFLLLLLIYVYFWEINLIIF